MFVENTESQVYFSGLENSHYCLHCSSCRILEPYGLHCGPGGTTAMVDW
jgi:hypothetical protein